MTAMIYIKKKKKKKKKTNNNSYYYYYGLKKQNDKIIIFSFSNLNTLLFEIDPIGQVLAQHHVRIVSLGEGGLQLL